MRRKYLDDIGATDRPDLWDDCNEHKEQRKLYGFDGRELFDMQHSFYLWLYERLKMWTEIDPYIDQSLHEFLYNGKVYNQKELIQMMLYRLDFYLSKDYSRSNKENFEYVSEVGDMWSIVMPTMWM